MPINNDEVKIALYQVWPGKKYRKYNVTDIAPSARTVAVFPATKEGLDQAVNAAERADAVLVKLEKNYFDSDKLFRVVTDKIRENKFVSVFKAVGKLPGK
jgi:hypothetical protein